MPATKSYNPNKVVGLTISMSWQLALIVLLPVFGGHLLDAKVHPKGVPIYTLVGLIIALAGMIAVVRTTLKQLNKVTGMNEPSNPASKADNGAHNK